MSFRKGHRRQLTPYNTAELCQIAKGTAESVSPSSLSPSLPTVAEVPAARRAGVPVREDAHRAGLSGFVFPRRSAVTAVAPAAAVVAPVMAAPVPLPAAVAETPLLAPVPRAVHRLVVETGLLGSGNIAVTAPAAVTATGFTRPRRGSCASESPVSFPMVSTAGDMKRIVRMIPRRGSILVAPCV